MRLEVLKIKVTMPNAQFRVVHSGNPRKTYPVPPYSTVIGFLSNIMGSMDWIEKMLSGSMALGILSQYEYISREYTWLRNLNSKYHDGRFATASNRFWQEIAEHPGGQSPVMIEVLNNITIWLYVYHSNPGVLEIMLQNHYLPEKWFSHLHLGRSEDWAAIEYAGIVEMVISNQADDMGKTGQYFQWMPKPDFAFGMNQYVSKTEYEELYRKIQGPAALVTSIYELIEAHLGNGEIGTIRNFKHVPVRLTNSPIPFLYNFKLPALMADPEISSSVYLAQIRKPSGKMSST